MIERIAVLKLKPEHATPAARAEIVRHALDTLRPLPGVQGITAGVPADEPTTRSWDLSIIVRFGTPEDAESYRAHPVHRRFVDEYLAPRCEVRKGWSFVVESR